MQAVMRLSCVTASLLMFALIPSTAAAQEALQTAPALVACGTATPAAAQTDSGYVFEGCWAWFPASQCLDVYRDSGGGYWLCRACGQTTKPGPGQCSSITIQTLNTGYWCS